MGVVPFNVARNSPPSVRGVVPAEKTVLLTIREVAEAEAARARVATIPAVKCISFFMLMSAPLSCRERMLFQSRGGNGTGVLAVLGSALSWVAVRFSTE